MFYRIFLLTMIFSASVFADDLTKIPFETAEGKTTSLADYQGKVILLVNVASKCGFTKQYEALQKLYDGKKGKGLVILAFPCNDFGGQEPGSIEEIQAFCKQNYGVTFPIMAKVHVKGDEQHALFKAITGEKGVLPGDIKWNFGKILINKKGVPVERYEALTSPDSEKLSKEIDKLLAE